MSEAKEFDVDAWIARIAAREVKMSVAGADGVALCFMPGMSCGPDPDNNPGVSFRMFIAGATEQKLRCAGHFANGAACNIGRTDAKRLADMIYEFLEDPNAD